MTKTIQLTQGKIALVDDDDYEKIKEMKWYAHKDSNTVYAEHREGKKHIKLHRLLLNLKPNEFCDHINGDGLDNRRKNLRKATRSQNKMNTQKNKEKTSQFKGVSWRKQRDTWIVLIKDGEEQLYLGSFSSEVEAAKAYDKAAEQFFGEYAHLNFPQIARTTS